MIEVLVIPTGDSAEADTPEDALFAAQTLLCEARDEHHCRSARAAFYVGGTLIRSDVSLTDLDHLRIYAVPLPKESR